MIFIDYNNNRKDKLVTFEEKIYKDKFKFKYLSLNSIIYDTYIHIPNIFKKIYSSYIKKRVNKILSNEEDIYITSKILDENSEFKDYIIKSIIDEKYKEVKNRDTIIYNSTRYLEKFDHDEKLLCIINSKFNAEILLEYLNKFKKVDILYLNEKVDLNYIKTINNINLEYGTSIKFVKDKDLTKYDIYVIFNDIDLKEYMLNKRAYILNLVSSENDIYSIEYKLYNKYKDYLPYEEKFSNNKIGCLISKCLTSSV